MVVEELIKECKKNNPKAQEQLYKLFVKKLFGVCLKYSSSYADAQDNLQDGFLIIFRKIDQYSGKGSFEGWCKRIMINNALQKYKGIHILEVLNESIPEVEIEVEWEEENFSIDYLMEIIQELPHQYRMVFSLYVLDGYSHQEISEMLGISTGTSKSNLHRARLLLKEKIENRKNNPLESSAQ
ncbi:RNA polymerase sigma factor [Flavobacterium sp. UMI-01]|uniref:RNA polymerase sigma factor n=1 Tax=Flavobacterium sp. UMI-01 TaxID=1441053 RepID=UPI001C7CB78E|nr:RNA polymerase sigma factor [Flavobacterium sp. UMI-01]GIZ08070.1 DNA-directed RNA polymerase sigma-70 factor [Flavobacterium sp. UMI-01]